MVVRFVRPDFSPLIDGLFEEAFTSRMAPNLPAADITELDDRYEVVMETPGLKKDDVKISVEDGTMTLNGERKHYGFPEGTTVLRHETSTRPFSRSFSLPEDVVVSSIHAELKDGILRIQLPKSVKARPQEITIR
jgi:HSP20 family protein